MSCNAEASPEDDRWLVKALDGDTGGTKTKKTGLALAFSGRQASVVGEGGVSGASTLAAQAVRVLDTAA